MKRLLPLVARALCLAAFFPLDCRGAGRWQGVDETVVGKVAREAGRPPVAPLLPTGEGDLQLFAFLLAGAIGRIRRRLHLPQPVSSLPAKKQRPCTDTLNC